MCPFGHRRATFYLTGNGFSNFGSFWGLVRHTVSTEWATVMSIFSQTLDSQQPVIKMKLLLPDGTDPCEAGHFHCLRRGFRQASAVPAFHGSIRIDFLRELREEKLNMFNFCVTRNDGLTSRRLLHGAHGIIPNGA